MAPKHALKEAVCRNPKCLHKTNVYINGEMPAPLRGFYTYNCPKCKKQVMFPPYGLQSIHEIPPNAILATPLE